MLFGPKSILMDLVRESKKSTHPIPYMNSEQKGVFEKREGVKKGLSFCGKIVFDTSAHAYYCPLPQRS